MFGIIPGIRLPNKFQIEGVNVYMGCPMVDFVCESSAGTRCFNNTKMAVQIRVGLPRATIVTCHALHDIPLPFFAFLFFFNFTISLQRKS